MSSAPETISHLIMFQAFPGRSRGIPDSLVPGKKHDQGDQDERCENDIEAIAVHRVMHCSLSVEVVDFIVLEKKMRPSTILIITSFQAS